MADFANNFPDANLMSQLGDSITLIHKAGGSETIDALFEMKIMDDGLADSIDLIYPTILCNTADASKVKKTDTVRRGTINYKVLKKVPSDVGQTLVILKN